MTKPHLVGAYGMFWDRDEVDWRPGSGPAAWQLLGRIHTIRPKVRVCDFRRAQGFYVLFDDFGVNYVGLARGRYGIGARLRRHHISEHKRWSRFCWFSFDDVVDHSFDSWSRVQRRAALRNISSENVLRECEALLITALGTREQNQMRFQEARRWRQLRREDFLPGGLARRADAGGYTDRRLRDLAEAD
jgi:hypothetical protein